MTIHATAKMNDKFGISDIQAQHLIDTELKPMWDKFTSGAEGDGLTTGDILQSITYNERLTIPERCFLCAHLMGHFEILKIRDMFLRNDREALLREIGLPI
jgi:hypothetical protein